MKTPNNTDNPQRGTNIEIPGKGLSPDELALLRDVIVALRSLRYGSVNLTVHDGRLVEIQKVEKIRLNGAKLAI
jgi:hypothetical protein